MAMPFSGITSHGLHGSAELL